MKTRRVMIASVLGPLLVTAGLVGAVAASSSPALGDPAQANMAMTAMHDTLAMERMHAAMPATLQAQCDAMHADMAAMHADMNGMMDGSPGTESAGMDTHHTTGMMG